MVDLKRAYEQKGGSVGRFRLAQKAFKKLAGKEDRTAGTRLEPLGTSHTGFWGTAIGDRRYYEYCIDVGDRVYVLGTAKPDNRWPGGSVVARGTEEKTFIIGSKNTWWRDARNMEGDIAHPFKEKAIAYITAALLILLIGGVVLAFML